MPKTQTREPRDACAGEDLLGLRRKAVRVGLGGVLRFILIVAAGWIGVAGVARADFAQDLTRIHAEAVGGRAAVNALKAFKATGVTRNERGDLRFIMWAARPNQFRIEITSGERTILQAWDGRKDPWLADSQTRQVSVMRGERATDLKAEAEFDDPMLAGPDRKMALDYVGVVDEEGRKLIKVFVTQNFTETSFIYLDAASYFIVRRDVARRRGSAEAVLRTEYDDFRPVAGVMLPHRIVISQNGKRIRETIIDRMEPNPAMPRGFFELPSGE